MKTRSKPLLLVFLLTCVMMAFSYSNAWAEGEPFFFKGCTVMAINTPGGAQTSLAARVFDSNGTVPTTIDSLTITGPGGFAYSFTDGDYLAYFDVYGRWIPGQPLDGEYTCTVTDNEGKTATSYSYLKVGDTIPLPDPSTFQASTFQGSGDFSHTLSWGAVSG